jgi:hypothetical protein
MGFWSYLFGKSVKRNSAKDYFECERYFSPSGEQIGLSVTGELSVLTRRQEDFIGQVEKEYPLIVGAVIPAIEDEFQNWKPDFKIGDFKREFKLVHLAIPTCEQQPVEWEMSFETIHDLNHVVVVSMLDLQLLHIHVDG